MTLNSNNTHTPQLSLPPDQGEGLLPNLIFPDLTLAPDDYAKLELRLDFYSDFIVASQFENGQQAVPAYVVDPLQLAAALGGINLNSGLMPPDCLFWGMSGGYPRLGLFVSARVWSLPLRHEGKTKTVQVPLPPLIFIGHRYDYAIWAVTERPTSLNAQIFIAPCPNIGLITGVCQGNVTFPQAGNSTIWQAVEIFFSSKFNSDLGQHKSQHYPDNVLEQWLALDQAAARHYPLEDLLPVKNLTMGRLINDDISRP